MSSKHDDDEKISALDPSVASNVDPEAENDADNKEVFAYVMGGASTQIANSDLYLKQQLMMFALALNPILISLMGVFGMLWDAITDPIMANISDNSKNRWGRRRPFILAGGILAALASIVMWGFFPKTHKLKLNAPEIPAAVQSQDALSNFGKMMKGYGIADTKLTLSVLGGHTDAEKKKDNINEIVKSALRSIGGVSLATDDPNAIPLELTLTGFEKENREQELIGQSLSAVASLGDSVSVHNTLFIENEYPEERRLGIKTGDFLKSRNAYIGLRYDGEEIDFKCNTFEREGLYRAETSIIEKSLIEALGNYYNLPYERCFPLVTAKGDILRMDVQISETQSKTGLKKEKQAVYTSVLNAQILRIEKRIKYNEIKQALRDREITESLKKVLAELNVSEEDVAAIKAGFLEGKLSNNWIRKINTAGLTISSERVKSAAAAFISAHNGNSYEAYKELHTEFLLYGIGYNMDLLNYGISDKDQSEINRFLQKSGLSDFSEVYGFLWSHLDEPFDASEVTVKLEDLEGSLGTPRYLKSETILGRFASPKFKGTKDGMWANLTKGLAVIGDDEADDKVFFYMMVALIIMATFSTIGGVPYYALGIELAPSYDGRTKLVIWRSVVSKIIGFTRPWLFPFVLLPLFLTPIHGAFWLGTGCAVISIPLLIYSMTHCKERIVMERNKKKTPFWTSIKYTIKIPEFWRIVALFFIIQKSLGIFAMVGGYLTIYYVFHGSLLQGATYTAAVGSFGVFMAFVSLPLVKWICDKYEKHNALRFAFIMMMIGCALKWFCVDPERPYLLFVLPFFFSIGISSVYTVMQTLMADVTDVDELRTGSRREGMFGAVNSTIMKATGPIGAIAAGIIVVASGFDVDMGAYQEEGVFTTMRIIFSILPAILLSLGLVVLRKYPLTRKRMYEIKTILKERRAAEHKALQEMENE